MVIDPDSRLTQLGLIPVCDDSRYFFFESRAFGGSLNAAKAVMDHLLSLMLLAAMVFELVTVQRAATSVFLILIVLSFVDVITGLSVATPDARRSIALEPDQISAAG